MTQTTESGRRSNEIGQLIAKSIATDLCIHLEAGSNKGIYNERKIVIKSARLGNNKFGITNRMLEEIQDVILAKEVSENIFELYKVSCQKLINTGKPTASKGNSSGKVTSFSISTATSYGVFMKKMTINLPYPPNSKIM